MYFKNNFYVYSSPQSHKHNITLKRIKNFKGKVNFKLLNFVTYVSF